MKIIYFFFILLCCSQLCLGQETYKDSLNSFIEDYVSKHEVVTGDDKKLMQFYPVNDQYRVTAQFERSNKSKWFSMKTSGPMKQTYRVYGILSFVIDGTPVKLNIYQSEYLMTTEEHKNHLFLPFTDLTSGEETYGGGRYIDFNISDIANNTLVIDFNKAYNPYCAYVSDRYNCPIPPKENDLKVAIRAGEKTYLKKH